MKEITPTNIVMEGLRIGIHDKVINELVEDMVASFKATAEIAVREEVEKLTVEVLRHQYNAAKNHQDFYAHFFWNKEETERVIKL